MQFGHLCAIRLDLHIVLLLEYITRRKKKEHRADFILMVSTVVLYQVSFSLQVQMALHVVRQPNQCEQCGFFGLPEGVGGGPEAPE